MASANVPIAIKDDPVIPDRRNPQRTTALAATVTLTAQARNIGVSDRPAIERDLEQTGKQGKKLFIQIQDRFFSPEARNIPDYILEGADTPISARPLRSTWRVARIRVRRAVRVAASSTSTRSAL